MLGLKSKLMNIPVRESTSEPMEKQLVSWFKKVKSKGYEIDMDAVGLTLFFVFTSETLEQFIDKMLEYVKCLAKKDLEYKKGKKMEEYHDLIQAALDNIEFKLKGLAITSVEFIAKKAISGESSEKCKALLAVLSTINDDVLNQMKIKRTEIEDKLNKKNLKWDAEQDGNYGSVVTAMAALMKARRYLGRALKRKHIKSVETYAFEMGMQYQKLLDTPLEVPAIRGKKVRQAASTGGKSRKRIQDDSIVESMRIRFQELSRNGKKASANHNLIAKEFSTKAKIISGRTVSSPLKNSPLTDFL